MPVRSPHAATLPRSQRSRALDAENAHNAAELQKGYYRERNQNIFLIQWSFSYCVWKVRKAVRIWKASSILGLLSTRTLLVLVRDQDTFSADCYHNIWNFIFFMISLPAGTATISAKSKKRFLRISRELKWSLKSGIVKQNNKKVSTLWLISAGLFLTVLRTTNRGSIHREIKKWSNCCYDRTKDVEGPCK